MLPDPFFIYPSFSYGYNDLKKRETLLNIFTNLDLELKIGLAGEK